MRHRTHILTLILAAISATAAYTDPANVKHYSAVRKSAVSGIGLDEVKSNPTSCAGKVVEVRGRLAGTFRKDDAGSGSAIITTERSGSFVVSMKKLPTDNPGVEVACLADVTPSGDLAVREWTYDAELRRYEESLMPRSASRAAADRKPVPAKAATAKRAAATTTLTGDQMIGIYSKAIKQFNPKLTSSQADVIARSVLGFSYKYKVDARLVCAVILAESHFKIGATSRCGAMGLGQLMPTTAAGLGVNNAYDPVENVYGSTRYIKGVLDRVTGNKHWNDLTWNDLALGLAAYNAGPGAVKKHGGIPPYRETQNYVRRVVSIYKKLCGVK